MLVKGTMLRSANSQTLWDMANRAAEVLGKINSSAQEPLESKVPPSQTGPSLAKLCGLSPHTYKFYLKDGAGVDLPGGTSRGHGRSREFNFDETKEWLRHCKKLDRRPEGADAIVITTSNFKGGASKTSTTISIGQGLNLLYDFRVLLIDLDAQGSLTQLFGIIPDAHVSREQTAEPLFEGEEENLAYAVRKTYWPGIDLVAAGPALYNAEFFLPSRTKDDPSFQFWEVLRKGIEPLKPQYDVILVDTPPSLSYTTINAMIAADGLIVPIVPEPLDFASSAQFWNLFADVSTALGTYGKEKHYDFIDILLSKVENSSVTVPVRGWLSESYGDYVMPVEIPKTSVLSNSNAEFKSVYEVVEYAGNAQTFTRAREAYDGLVGHIQSQVVELWNLRMGDEA
jgi:chromosome partitioning protein